MTTTIFGREPAAVVGIIEAVLVMFLTFGWFNLSQETVGLIMAVVTTALGVWLAYVTHHTVLGALTGLAKAVLALAAVYGFALTDAQTGAVIALITMIVGFWHRTQTSPAMFPGFTED